MQLAAVFSHTKWEIRYLMNQLRQTTLVSFKAVFSCVGTEMPTLYNPINSDSSGEINTFYDVLCLYPSATGLYTTLFQKHFPGCKEDN